MGMHVNERSDEEPAFGAVARGATKTHDDDDDDNASAPLRNGVHYRRQRIHLTNPPVERVWAIWPPVDIANAFDIVET